MLSFLVSASIVGLWGRGVQPTEMYGGGLSGEGEVDAECDTGDSSIKEQHKNKKWECLALVGSPCLFPSPLPPDLGGWEMPAVSSIVLPDSNHQTLAEFNTFWVKKHPAYGSRRPCEARKRPRGGAVLRVSGRTGLAACMALRKCRCVSGWS